MPRLKNDYYNNFTRISLEINLIKNRMFDFHINREDYLNWIPFEFQFNVGDTETYAYPQEYGATFSFDELKYLLKGIDSLINAINTRESCNAETLSDETRAFEFSTVEAYFDISFIDAYDNLIAIELWINMGSLSRGSDSGYDRGFRFTVEMEELIKFRDELKEQLDTLIKQSD